MRWHYSVCVKQACSEVCASVRSASGVEGPQCPEKNVHQIQQAEVYVDLCSGGTASRDPLGEASGLQRMKMVKAGKISIWNSIFTEGATGAK